MKVSIKWKTALSIWREPKYSTVDKGDHSSSLSEGYKLQFKRLTFRLGIGLTMLELTGKCRWLAWLWTRNSRQSSKARGMWRRCVPKSMEYMFSWFRSKKPVYMKVRRYEKVSGMMLGTLTVDVPSLRRLFRYPLWRESSCRWARNCCSSFPTETTTSGGVAKEADAIASLINHARYNEYIMFWPK